jgi:hypothetical protein
MILEAITYLASNNKENINLNLDLSSMKSVQWSQGASTLETLRGQQLKDKCESELCFGTSLSPGASSQPDTTISSQENTNALQENPSSVMKQALQLSGVLFFGSQALTTTTNVVTAMVSNNMSSPEDDFHPRSAPHQVGLSYPVAGLLLAMISFGFAYLYTKLFPKKIQTGYV